MTVITYAKRFFGLSAALSIPAKASSVFLLALLLASCATQVPAPVSRGVIVGGGIYKIGDPYKVAGVWYYPREAPDYDQTGIASWYGRQFHGKKTANGEIFNMNALTAAHKTLPMPSTVRVTNLENGRWIILRVNDRGPFIPGRIIDVSRRGAEALGFRRKGTARVRVEAVAGARRPPERFILARVETSAVERNLVSAAPVATVNASPLPPPPGLEEAPPAVARASGKMASLPPEVAVVPVRPTGIFVQAGAFTFKSNARRITATLRAFGPVQVVPVTVDGQEFYRVRIGPLATVEEADATLSKVLDSGQEARIVIEDCPC